MSLKPVDLISIELDSDSGGWARGLPGGAALYVLPGENLSEQNPRLSVGTIEATPPPPGAVWDPIGQPLVAELAGAEVSAAVIEFPIDIDSVPPGVDPSDFFGVAWFDELAGEWRVADSSVDMAAGVVRVETSHLSLWNPFTWGTDDHPATVSTLSGGVDCNSGFVGGGWNEAEQPSRLEFDQSSLESGINQTVFTWAWEKPEWTYSGSFADNPTGRYSLSVPIAEGANSTLVSYTLWCGETKFAEREVRVYRSDTTRYICRPGAEPGCGHTYEVGQCLVGWFFAGAPLEEELAWFVLDGNLGEYPEVAMQAVGLVAAPVGVALDCLDVGRGKYEAGDTSGRPEELPRVGPSASIRLSRGAAYAPGNYWYSVTLSGFAPGSRVTLTCHDSVDSGFWTQTFLIDGSGGASDSKLCYTPDGPDHWVTGGGVMSNIGSWGATSPTPAPTTSVAPPTGEGIMNGRSSLRLGDEMYSPNGEYKLRFQLDGNLVLSDSALRPWWATGTDGEGATIVRMQGDGNLVVYKGDTPLWASNTAGKPDAYLQVQNNGYVTIREPDGTVLRRYRWSTPGPAPTTTSTTSTTTISTTTTTTSTTTTSTTTTSTTSTTLPPGLPDPPPGPEAFGLLEGSVCHENEGNPPRTCEFLLWADGPTQSPGADWSVAVRVHFCTSGGVYRELWDDGSSIWWCTNDVRDGGHYEPLTVHNASSAPRTYEIEPGSYCMSVSSMYENRAGWPVVASTTVLGPTCFTIHEDGHISYP